MTDRLGNVDDSIPVEIGHNTLRLVVDARLGGCPPSYVLAPSENFLMQVPPEVRECVAFLAYRTSNGLKFCGTAFFVSVPIESTGMEFIYAVTAKHVIRDMKLRGYASDGRVHIRCTGRHRNLITVQVDLSHWHEHPSSTSDVAAIVIPKSIGEAINISGVPIAMFADEKVIESENIGLGDEVFLPGLFTKHVGTERNIPILRTGTIACMPEEPVSTKDYGFIDAYLIEARSIGGLSGSPVFVYVPSTRIGRDRIMRESDQVRYFLLGLMHGHWDAQHVEGESINMGIAVVVPSLRIRELLEMPHLKAQRDNAGREFLEENSTTPDNEPCAD